MQDRAPRDHEIEDLETELLLEAVYRHYGNDFREYAPASLKRRIAIAMRQEKVATISGLQEKVLHDRCRIYATDMNGLVLRQARAGIFPADTVQQGAANYGQAQQLPIHFSCWMTGRS